MHTEKACRLEDDAERHVDGPYSIDASYWFDVPVTSEQWSALQLLGKQFASGEPSGIILINGISMWWDGNHREEDGVVIVSGCGGRILPCAEQVEATAEAFRRLDAVVAACHAKQENH